MGLMRNKVNSVFGTLILLCACSGQEAEPYRAPERLSFEHPKNAVVFLVDTLRADHLGCYGYERDTTPRIDAFAAESILFENCVSQSTWTKPASASVLTGLYPSSHGMLSESAVLPESVKNIAGLLEGTGLASAAFVGNQYVFRGQGEMLRGFDYTKGFSNKEDPSYAKSKEIVDGALQWIEDRGETPFFVYVHTVDPHAPYGGAKEFSSKFVTPGTSELDGKYILKADHEELDNLGEADRQRLIDLYDGDVAYTDFQFGRFRDRMDEMGHTDDTMIVFVADHGEEFNEHKSWQHNPYMHPEVIHVPLIVHLPGLNLPQTNQIRRDLCAQVDIVPTVLDGLGLWPMKGLQGRTLLTDPGSTELPPIFSEIEGGLSIKALTTKDFKYVRRWAPNARETLFDLNADPNAFVDVSKDNTVTLKLLRARLENYVESSSSGFSVLFQNESADWAQVEVEATSDAPFDRAKPFFADTKKRHGDKRDGPPQFSQGEGEYHAQMTLHTKSGDGDGISFTPSDDATFIELNLTLNGAPVSPLIVHLGPHGVHPDKLPFQIQMNGAAELNMPQPQARGGFKNKDFRFLIWANMRTLTDEVAITAEERRDLEAIGYAGDDAEDEE